MSPSVGLLDLQPHNRAHWGALRTGIAVGIPLLILNSLGHLDWSLFAVFGAFTAIYGRGASYGARLRMQVSAAVCLVAAVVLGATVGAIQAGSFLAVAACAIVSPLAFVASRRFGWLPPSALFILFAVGATSSIPQPLSVVPVALAIAAAAAVLSIGLGQAGRLFPAGRTHAKAAASAGSSLRSVLGSPDAPPSWFGTRRGRWWPAPFPACWASGIRTGPWSPP